MAARESALDGFAARLTAGLIALAAAALLIWINWDRFVPPPEDAAADASLNPRYVACRDQRLGDVTKMNDDGVITNQQFQQFSERALATCAGQFPPGGTPE